MNMGRNVVNVSQGLAESNQLSLIKPTDIIVMQDKILLTEKLVKKNELKII